MPRLFCLIFGHKPPCYDHQSGGDYGHILNRGIDGIGRKHGDVYADCPRCGKEYRVCRVHQHKDR